MQILIAVLGSSALSALVSGLFAIYRDKKTKETGVSEGVKLLMYAKIKEQGKQYIANGSISAEELEDIIVMHRCYHDALGGNGFLNSIMDQVKRLPIKE